MAKKRRYKTNVNGEFKRYTEEENTPETNITVAFSDIEEPVVEEPAPVNYKVMAKGGLRLRKGPSLDDRAITILNYLSWINIDQVKDSGEWGHAVMSDGTEGWVMMKFIKKM